ncbi:MAG: MerR family DNA-binding protein [Gemmataceae bacterium]|nr:MerR family DNA-binding protein [Gemmataceae bacterium]
MATLHTAEVARQASVNIETLRFYERQGILPEPPRRASGYREYPPETVSRVRFIKRAQELGFSLKEIKELLDLTTVPRAKSGRVRHLAQAKLAEIDHKLHDLEAMKRTLMDLVCACDGRLPLSSCPIIESLSGCPRCGEGNTESP